MHTNILRATGPALLALACLAVPAVAQERGNKAEPQRPAATPPAGEAQRQDPAQQRQAPAAERPAAGTQPQAPAQRPDGSARGGGMSADEVFKKMALEETKHRERLAKLQRLHDLAQEKNQTERLAQIKELVAKENERYGALRERGRKAVGDDAFNAAEARLSQGRRGAQAAQHQQRREDAAGKPADRPEHAQQPQRPEGERKPDAKPEGERKPQGDRKPDAKPEGERKPEGDRKPQGDRKPDAKPEGDRKPQGERPKGDGNGRGQNGGGNQGERGNKPRR